MNLDHNLSAGHRIVMHIGIEIGKTAPRKIAHLGLIEAISHPYLKSPCNHSYVLAFRMPVRGDAISVRHLQAHGVIPAAGAWIALKYRELRSCREKRRRRTVRNGVGRKGMFT